MKKKKASTAFFVDQTGQKFCSFLGGTDLFMQATMMTSATVRPMIKNRPIPMETPIHTAEVECCVLVSGSRWDGLTVTPGNSESEETWLQSTGSVSMLSQTQLFREEKFTGCGVVFVSYWLVAMANLAERMLISSPVCSENG